MKYLLLIPAIVLDTTQFLLGVLFAMMQFATPVGGGIGGAAAAGAYCWYTTPGAIASVLSAAKCAFFGAAAGAGVSAFALPLGAALDVALSISVGGGILLWLALEGAFYPDKIVKGFFCEITPFFNFLPGWTYMVWQCIREKQRRESGKAGSSMSGALGFITGAASSAIPGGSLLQGAAALAQRRSAAQQTQNQEGQGSGPEEKRAPRAPLLNSRVNADIRPPQAANDNTPRKAYAA